MDKYLTAIERYMENAINEPFDTENYQKGLEIGLDEVRANGENTKQGLVDGLTDKLKVELAKSEPNYEMVKGMVTSLKEALKLEGDLSLDKYMIETRVGVMVRDKEGNMMPKSRIGTNEYTDKWTMPEILTYDITFTEFAYKVS